MNDGFGNEFSPIHALALRLDKCRQCGQFTRLGNTAGAAAENIAEGRMDLARLFDMWMKSPPHRRNMLDARFTRFGLAYVSDGKNADWRYWALVLGK